MPDQTPNHGCTPGDCKCPCPHLPAMSVNTVTSSPPTPHAQLTVLYVPLPAQERSTSFFRPPI
jgi:hypothetical protein